MLYPNFNDLMTFKERASNLNQPFSRSIKSTISGNHYSPFRGQGLEFDSVRPYVLGDDDIRSIDWRVTARMGSPHLKLFREDRERQMIICVDVNAAMRFGTKKTFKSIQAARIAAALGWQGIAYQDRVSACLFGDVPNGIHFFKPTRTQKSFCHMLKMLTEPPPEQHRISLENILQHLNQVIPKRSLLYFISDFMNNENSQYEASLSRLSKKGEIIFIAVNDPLEKTIYPMGLMGFCMDEKKVYVNTKSPVGREIYAKQWKENRQQLYTLTSKLKIPLIELTTESDIQKDLFLELRNIVKRKKK